MNERLEELAAKLGYTVVDIPPFAGVSMESVTSFLVVQLFGVERAAKITNHILKREMLGSTAIGNGVAIPHTMSSTVDRVYGVFARCSVPINWDAPDGRPIDSVFLVVVPTDRPGDHFRVLEQISRAARQT